MEFKNYNSQRKKLLLPEYGRHIQNMVDQLCEIKDRDLRTAQAYAVIDVMGNLNNNLRDTPDLRHKLWDHLFIMSDFKLDVDSPYPTPSSESLKSVPEPIPYPQGNIAYKQYGRNIRNVIELIKASDNEEERLYLAQNVARFMKVKSYEYNQEFPSDEVIINDLRLFSDDVIRLDEDSLNSTRLNYRNNTGNNKSLTNKFGYAGTSNKKRVLAGNRSNNPSKRNNNSFSSTGKTGNYKTYKRTK